MKQLIINDPSSGGGGSGTAYVREEVDHDTTWNNTFYAQDVAGELWRIIRIQANGVRGVATGTADPEGNWANRVSLVYS
jgi:hypothetical protein